MFNISNGSFITTNNNNSSNDTSSKSTSKRDETKQQQQQQQHQRLFTSSYMMSNIVKKFKNFNCRDEHQNLFGKHFESRPSMKVDLFPQKHILNSNITTTSTENNKTNSTKHFHGSNNSLYFSTESPSTSSSISGGSSLSNKEKRIKMLISRKTVSNNDLSTRNKPRTSETAPTTPQLFKKPYRTSVSSSKPSNTINKKKSLFNPSPRFSSPKNVKKGNHLPPITTFRLKKQKATKHNHNKAQIVSPDSPVQNAYNRLLRMTMNNNDENHFQMFISNEKLLMNSESINIKQESENSLKEIKNYELLTKHLNDDHLILCNVVQSDCFDYSSYSNENCDEMNELR
jgi:hypothetical protein